MSKKNQMATGMRALLGGTAAKPVAEDVPLVSAAKSITTEADEPTTHMAEPVLTLVEPRREAPMPSTEPARVTAVPEASNANATLSSSPPRPEVPAQPDATNVEVAPAAQDEGIVEDAEDLDDHSPGYIGPPVGLATLRNPTLRQRDQQLTRKFGVVLPVDLKTEVDIYCVKRGMRSNEFVRLALEEKLARIKQSS